MLVEDIKRRITEAMKAGRAVERDVLRVALGEIQAAENRGQAMNDEEGAKLVRKLLKSNSETLAAAGDRLELKTKLEEEIRVLEALLPKRLDVEQIAAALAAVEAEIKAAKSEGQATGVAMKHLKTLGASADGKDVGAAVKKMRSA